MFSSVRFVFFFFNRKFKNASFMEINCYISGLMFSCNGYLCIALHHFLVHKIVRIFFILTHWCSTDGLTYNTKHTSCIKQIVTFHTSNINAPLLKWCSNNKQDGLHDTMFIYQLYKRCKCRPTVFMLCTMFALKLLP